MERSVTNQRPSGVAARKVKVVRGQQKEEGLVETGMLQDSEAGNWQAQAGSRTHGNVSVHWKS